MYKDKVTCEVKGCNGEHVAEGPAQDGHTVPQLVEPVNRVFKPSNIQQKYLIAILCIHVIVYIYTKGRTQGEKGGCVALSLFKGGGDMRILAQFHLPPK